MEKFPVCSPTGELIEDIQKTLLDKVRDVLVSVEDNAKTIQYSSVAGLRRQMIKIIIRFPESEPTPTLATAGGLFNCNNATAAGNSSRFHGQGLNCVFDLSLLHSE